MAFLDSLIDFDAKKNMLHDFVVRGWGRIGIEWLLDGMLLYCRPANSNIKWRVRYCLLEPGQGRFSVYSLYAQCLASDGTDAEAANVSEAERDFSELTVVPAAAINKGWHAPSSIVTGHERSDAASAVAAIALGMGLVHPAYSVALDSGASMAVNAEASVDAVGRMLPDSPIATLAPLNRYKVYPHACKLMWPSFAVTIYLTDNQIFTSIGWWC